jgi:hypothetical protein
MAALGGTLCITTLPKNPFVAAVVGEPHAMRVSFSFGVHGGCLKYF